MRDSLPLRRQERARNPAVQARGFPGPEIWLLAPEIIVDGQRLSDTARAVLMTKEVIWWGGKLPEIEVLTANGRDCMPGLLEIEFTEAGPDYLTARMPVDHRTHQPFGRLHGGASVVLAETVGSVASSKVVDPEKFVGVGMEINANHIRPVFDGYVHATARPESLGRSTQIWSIRIADEAGRLVCISRLTVALIARDGARKTPGRP